MSDQNVRRVLLVDDDVSVREALGQTLELANFEPTLAGSYIEAKDHIGRDFAGVIVSDIRMPGKDGFALLEYAHSLDEDLPVILLTGEGDIPMAVRGMSSGAFGFLEKPCAPKDFIAVVSKASQNRALVLENRRLKQQLEAGDAAARLLFGQSPQAHSLRSRVRAVARSGAEVLVKGEPGAGTSKVAEVIHLLSPASAMPFQKYPASALTTDRLIEVFENSDGGSLFIDGVGSLSRAAQFTLLELLEQEHALRVISGTYKDLQSEVDAGHFDAELFYKLDVMQVRIPSLRERPEDIPVLFRHYVDIACEQAALPKPDITSEINARLMAQEWPGNARALMNAAMRFVMGLSEIDAGGALGLAEQMAQVERSLLVQALQRHVGNATEAARALKLPRKTFYDKLTRHGIKAELYR